MATAHLNGARDHDDQLAGNLCRCTGYAPIIRAARAAEAAPVPPWMTDDGRGPFAVAGEGAFLPSSADDLAAWYQAHPDATLIAGATDVGLWVTKQFRPLGPLAFLSGCADLRRITATEGWLHIGAACTMTEVMEALRVPHPAYAELIRRYGSVQVRNAATIGGNIANGSPIGDNPPALIALGARLHLRQGDRRREIAIEDFFLDYGRQDRAPGEFVTGVSIPDRAPGFRVWKISKRFDQDISALCGAFNLTIADGVVTGARIAFGGLAGIPKRAAAVEAALTGRPWTAEAVESAIPAFAADFQPISDMRASAGYRLTVAGNLLRRYLAETSGMATDVLRVTA
jgi:xanthine dehydrogenase small subunit